LSAKIGKKKRIQVEQIDVVAARQQLRNKCDPTLPPSNQILATMFD